MSDTIQVHCPQCAVKLKFKISTSVATDKKVTCPKCEAPFVISKDILSNALASGQSTNLPVDKQKSLKPQSSELKNPETKSLQSEARPTTKQPTPALRPSTSKPEVAKSTVRSPVPTSGSELSKSPQARSSSEAPDSARKAQASLHAKAPHEPTRKPSDRKSKTKEISDDYGDELWDDTESPLDDWGSVPEESDPYETTRRAPSSRSGSKQKNGVRSQDEHHGGQSKLRSLGVVGWLLFGLLAGLAGAALTVVVGYSDNPWLIGMMALVVGIMAGIGVRFGASESFGPGPGLVAGTIAVLCILGGKVGAFYVAQDLPPTEEEVAEDAAEFEQNAAEATKDPVMISGIADDLNDEWLTAGKITDEQIEAHYDSIEANRPPEDPSENYLPEVWQEASKKWSEFTPEQKAAKTREIQQEWYGEDGLDPALNPVSEPESISYFADELQESWLESGRITDEQIRAHFEANETPEDYSEGYLPEVWKEATNRWNSKSEEQKKAARDQEIEFLKTAETIEAAIFSNLGVFAAVLQALLNCFWPFTGPLCFGAGVSLAYRLGSHGIGIK